MSKIKLIVLGLVLFASSVVFANVRINTYRHSPCDSWRFDGTCTFHSFSKIGAEGRSVQRALDLLNRKISNLELQMDIIIEENNELKEKLNSK